MASVYIPTPYREHTNGAATVEAGGATVGEILTDLARRFPGLGREILPGGAVPNHLAVYVNTEEIRNLSGLDTPVADRDELALIPALAGGSPTLSDEEMARYSRQVILPEVGVDGQGRLLASKVAVVGVGGLGAPVAMYLAAAGVGTIGLIDADAVEVSNLHRQPIHRTADAGRPKTDSGAAFIADLNPGVEVVRHQEVLSSANALAILDGYDVVVNGSDNFPTRYLVSDACHFLRKPLVDASILRFEGQATVFMPGQGCYRCLFPEPPAPGAAPSCAEAGVMGALAGQMGTLEAMETLKILLGIGETLSGRLLVYDALSARTRLLRWQRNPECALCGDHPTITALIDYEAFCGVGLPRRGVDFAAQVLPEEVMARAAGDLLAGGARFVDLRPSSRFERGTIPGAQSLPFEELGEGLSGLAGEKQVVFFCDIGQKSALAAMLAREQGIPAVSIRGGLVAWRNERLPWEEAR